MSSPELACLSIPSGRSSTRQKKRCNVSGCPYRSSDSRLLRSHIAQYHTGEKPHFVCSQCSLGFFDRRTHTKHLRSCNRSQVTRYHRRRSTKNSFSALHLLASNVMCTNFRYCITSIYYVVLVLNSCEHNQRTTGSSHRILFITYQRCTNVDPSRCARQVS